MCVLLLLSAVSLLCYSEMTDDVYRWIGRVTAAIMMCSLLWVRYAYPYCVKKKKWNYITARCGEL